MHKKIENYFSKNIKKNLFRYTDAFTYFSENNVKNANVLILQYVISHFYNTNQIQEIDVFFENLIDKIVRYKPEGAPLNIIINDVNSNNRGRDYFMKFCDKLTEKNLEHIFSQYYFGYNIQHPSQRYGEKHKYNDVLYTIPEKLDQYEPWRKCSSAQMLIQIK